MARNRMTVFVFAVAVALPMTVAAQVEGGAISGRVVDDKSNRPLSGAKVYAIRVWPRALTTQAASVKADGSFELAPLPGGRYRVCAYGVSGYATNCLWVAGSDVAIGGGQRAGGVTVRLKRGVKLTARVNDARGLLKSSQGRASQVAMFLGDGSGNYLPLNPIAEANGLRFEVFAPVDTALQLRAFAQGALLNDSGGQAVRAEGSQYGFTHAEAELNAGRAERVSTFEVVSVGQ